MKKLLPFIFVFSSVFCGYGESIPADDILAFVRSKLPRDPLTLSGTLKVRTKKGFTKTSLPVEMDLDWGAVVPMARYRIGKETLQIVWENNLPSYQFSNHKNQPSDDILGTGLTWVDLSFSVLWWPHSKLINEEKKINRDCYVVEVPVPGSKNFMRLWVEKKMGMLLEVQTLDEHKKELRRMKIKSIKKMDGMWVAKDLEIRDKASGNKTILQTTDLQWKTPKATVTAFDPSESINQIAIDLYKKLSAANNENLCLSPYSISTALAMTYGGARGETAEQMGNTLHFGGQGATHPAFSYIRRKLTAIQKRGAVQLSVANSLWPQNDYTFLPDFLALTREFYGSEIVSVDYKSDAEVARRQINVWVEAQTNERIKDLIPEGMLDSLTRLVLANAIYFKGAWANSFNPQFTQSIPFILASGKSLDVPMMSQTAEFKLARGKAFQVLELPYEGDDLSMLILLPSIGTPFPDLDLDMIGELKFTRKTVMVQLPRFKIESTFRLGDTLAAMGMPLAFSPRADFSGMTGTNDLHIGAIVHKAFLEVNEEGTEAAAATAVTMQTTSMPAKFIANHPFLFFIRENSTGTILFIGRVSDPS